MWSLHRICDSVKKCIEQAPDALQYQVAVGANSRGVAATPVKGVLTGGITPRISDLFSKSLKLKRISEHFRNPFDLD